MGAATRNSGCQTSQTTGPRQATSPLAQPARSTYQYLLAASSRAGAQIRGNGSSQSYPDAMRCGR